MDKKRLQTIKIFAIGNILVMLFMTYFFFRKILFGFQGGFFDTSYMKYICIFSIIILGASIISTIGAVGILLLKEWGRKIYLIIAWLPIIVYPYRGIYYEFGDLLPVIILISSIIYFTRPKVKEQFSR